MNIQKTGTWRERFHFRASVQGVLLVLAGLYSISWGSGYTHHEPLLEALVRTITMLVGTAISLWGIIALVTGLGFVRNQRETASEQTVDTYLRAAPVFAISGVFLFMWSLGWPIASSQSTAWRAGEGFVGVASILVCLWLIWLALSESGDG